MKIKLNVLIFVLALALAAGAQQKAAPSADEKAIRAEAEAWFAAGVAKDAAKFSSFYAPDANLFPPNEKMVSGKPQITLYWTNLFKTPGLAFSGATTRVEAAKSGDLAYERGTFKLIMNGPDGKPITQVGKYVVVWKKQPDGKWKAIADIFNSDEPPPPPPLSRPVASMPKKK